MGRHVLLACYDFPPNQGIGGRRWAKFAKQLAAKGYTVHVIKADAISGNQDSPWLKDVQSSNIRVHSLPRPYPEVISHPKGGVINKVKYKLALSKLYKNTAGTVYDIAIGWEEDYVRKAKALIQQYDIKNVMATGAPFNLLYYTAKLKEDLPGLNVLVDYRDPWLNAVNYGMADLEDARKEHEAWKQDYIFSQVDTVLAPNEFLLEEIKSTSKASQFSCNFVSLPHFYDEEDLEVYLTQERKLDEQCIRIVYGGTLYIGVEPHLEKLKLWLDQVKTDDPDLYKLLRLEFYSKEVHLKEIFQGHEGTVQFAPPIGKEIFNKLRQADFNFIFLSYHNKNFRTTKFFEFMPFKVPYVFIGEEGFVSQYIQQENLGLVVQDDFQCLTDALKAYQQKTVEYRTDFPHEQYSLQAVTGQLTNLFRA